MSSLLYRKIDCPACAERVMIPAVTADEKRVSGQLCRNCGVIISLDAYRVPKTDTQQFLEMYSWFDRDTGQLFVKTVTHPKQEKTDE